MTTVLEGLRGQRHAPVSHYPGKDPVPIVQEAGWGPGPVWTGAENLAPTGIRSPEHAAHSQSLYRLSYRGPQGRGVNGMIIIRWIFRKWDVGVGLDRAGSG